MHEKWKILSTLLLGSRPHLGQADFATCFPDWQLKYFLSSNAVLTLFISIIIGTPWLLKLNISNFCTDKLSLISCWKGFIRFMGNCYTYQNTYLPQMIAVYVSCTLVPKTPQSPIPHLPTEPDHRTPNQCGLLLHCGQGGTWYHQDHQGGHVYLHKSPILPQEPGEIPPALHLGWGPAGHAITPSQVTHCTTPPVGQPHHGTYRTHSFSSYW